MTCCPARPAGRRRQPSPAGQRGSQSLELALTLPIVAMVGTVVLLAGMVGAEVTAVHAAAREAARAAAAGDDVAARLAATGFGHLPAPRVEPAPATAAAGEPITVEVVAPSRVLARLGPGVRLRATATVAREP